MSKPKGSKLTLRANSDLKLTGGFKCKITFRDRCALFCKIKIGKCDEDDLGKGIKTFYVSVDFRLINFFTRQR